MNQLVLEFKKYLNKTMGLIVAVKTWEQKDLFPLFLHGLYDFYRTRIFNKNYLIAMAKSKERPTAICKHMWLAQEKAGIPCIYLSPPMASRNLSQLVAHRILFVVPGKQIYLPEIGIDWHEHCRFYQLSRKFRGSRKLLSPVAQAVAIHALTHPNKKNLALKHLAKTLSYTSMSISRAFDELEGHEIGSTIRKNKERFLHFKLVHRDLWNSLYPLLKSPVRKRIWVQCKGKPPGILSGISAVAKLTNLAEPEHPVYAIGYKQWRTLSLEPCEGPDDADIELELWHYDPTLFAISGHVDLFSLYLSLQEMQDERVEEALETIIAGIKWSKG
ncbi:MAG TPA: hypothetical protein VLE95_06235 [Chlamydiales bacterium]|nr:hypothetical protein [Chlamydiales bacterium]